MLTEQQIKAIEALEELQRICKKYNLTLYLLAGTALGAVREKGMIPWDDDIDVGLLCDEWYKLRSVLPHELKSDFQYLDYDVDPSFPRFYGKILYDKKNCVDILLIAKWTTKVIPAKICWHIRKMMFDFYKYRLNYVAPMHTDKSRLQVFRYKMVRCIRKVEYYASKPFMKKKDYIQVTKYIERYFENHPYNCYINLYSCYCMEKEMMKREWIEKQSIAVFEGKEYTTVGDTDAYLKHLYGDYMTPPPESKRIAVHNEVFSEH